MSPKITLWNKGKLIGQKPPLKLHEIWPIRIRLQLAERNLGIEVDDALDMAEQTEI